MILADNVSVQGGVYREFREVIIFLNDGLDTVESGNNSLTIHSVTFLVISLYSLESLDSGF